MARARNIKPGLYKNEDLAECSVWARYLFPGLWCIADRAGRLEDRPKRIKGELLPFDGQDVDPLLGELAALGFILRYEVDGVRYIQILAFDKHQNPHHKEAPSVFPSPQSPGLLPHGTGTKPEALPTLHEVKVSDKPEASPGLSGDESVKHGVKTLLIPDSLFSDPLSPKPPKGARRVRKPGPDVEVPDGFEAWYALYRRKDARADAEKAWRQLNPDEGLQARMLAAVKAWRWAEDPQKRPLPASWIRGERWNDESVKLGPQAQTGGFKDWKPSTDDLMAGAL